MSDAEERRLVEPPRGMFPFKLDDKGRGKMPQAFIEYLSALPEKKLFVTSLDRHNAQIYPMETWRHNEKFFQDYRENAKKARKVAFNANDLGGETEMDAQGRILFPPELRRTLALENQQLRIFAYRGRIEVLGEAIYESRKQEASETPQEDVLDLEEAGLL